MVQGDAGLGAQQAQGDVGPAGFQREQGLGAPGHAVLSAVLRASTRIVSPLVSTDVANTSASDLNSISGKQGGTSFTATYLHREGHQVPLFSGNVTFDSPRL
ncbi:hypothetical protein ACH4PU_21455 [Streptomyces sp. NPDC021100]|uniref:hypothetical protein n=1 Tax=Streptomyces sp. NPDC021100 TaxID=3365114 RepID=UPI0037B95915